MSVRAVAAAFRLGIRAPLRSRLVVALLPLLAAAAVALPLQLDSDGTGAGMLRMALSWPAGAVAAVLAVATLWAGSAAFATEIERKRHVSDAVSPASAFDLWCGRWLGLVALDALLLALAFAAVFAAARFRAGDAARRPVRVPLERDAAWDARVASLLAGDDAGAADGVLREMRSGTYLPVSPGEARAWRFVLPRGFSGPVLLEFSCFSAYGMAQGVEGSVAVRPPVPGAPDIVRFELSNDGDGTLSAEIPGGSLAGLDAVDVEFENAENRETGAGALVSHAKSLRLTVPGGTLAGNVVRAWAAVMAALSLVAALGLLCGCAFSPPVAAFVATGVAVAVLASWGGGGDPDADDGHDHGPAREPSAVSVALEGFSRNVSGFLGAAVSPLSDAETLDRLGDGVEIRPRAVFRAFAFCGVLLPLVLGAVAASVLRRREFP